MKNNRCIVQHSKLEYKYILVFAFTKLILNDMKKHNHIFPHFDL